MLADALADLGRELPPGSVFDFEMLADGSVHLQRLVIPASRRGGGTVFLAAVFSACDDFGVQARLEADPTDLPSDPSTLDLVRWYMRFGCVIESADDESIVMTRLPRDPVPGAAVILQEYVEARRHDISAQELDEMRVSSGFRR